MRRSLPLLLLSVVLVLLSSAVWLTACNDERDNLPFFSYDLAPGPPGSQPDLAVPPPADLSQPAADGAVDGSPGN